MTDIRGGARLSDDGRYRYTLWRAWDDHKQLPHIKPKPMIFVMLNPSTADANIDDPTIRRCIGFAQREGLGGMGVINLFAYRTPLPSDLLAARKGGIDIIGPDNLAFQRLYIGMAVEHGTPVVAAWGSFKEAATEGQRFRHRMRQWFPDKRLHCLGTTGTGAPKHPLYLKADAPITVWGSEA